MVDLVHCMQGLMANFAGQRPRVEMLGTPLAPVRPLEVAAQRRQQQIALGQRKPQVAPRRRNVAVHTPLVDESEDDSDDDAEMSSGDDVRPPRRRDNSDRMVVLHRTPLELALKVDHIFHDLCTSASN